MNQFVLRFRAITRAMRRTIRDLRRFPHLRESLLNQLASLKKARHFYVEV